MPQILSTVKLDLQARPTEPTVYAKVGDNLSRQISVELYNGGAAWPVPAGAEIAIRYMRADGCKGFYSRLPDKTPACTAKNNVITCTMVADVTAVAGIAMVDLAITDNDGTLCTFSVKMIVDRAPATDNDIPQGWYDLPTIKAINEAITALQKARGGVYGMYHCETVGEEYRKVITGLNDTLTAGAVIAIKFDHADTSYRPVLKYTSPLGAVSLNVGVPEDPAPNSKISHTITAGWNLFLVQPPFAILLQAADKEDLTTIPGYAAPTASTKGAVGQLYLDIPGKTMYKCVAVDGQTYIWEPVFNGGQVSGNVSFTGDRVVLDAWLTFKDVAHFEAAMDGSTPRIGLYGEAGDEPCILGGVAPPVTATDAANKGYVDSWAVIPGSAAPTESTKGTVGQLYLDTVSGVMYKCISVADGGYTWTPIFDGGAIHKSLNMVGGGLGFTSSDNQALLAMSAYKPNELTLAGPKGSHLVRINGIDDPNDPTDASTKGYVDKSVSSKANAAGYAPNKLLGTDATGAIKETDLQLDDFTPAIRASASGEVIAVDDVAAITHDVDCRVESKNVFNSAKQQLRRLKFENGVYTPTIQDNSRMLSFKFQLFQDGVFVTQSKKQITDPGIFTISVTADTDTDMLRFSNHGETVQSDLVFPYALKRWETLTISAEFLTVGVNTWSYKNVQIEKGSSATAYTPYVPDLTKVKVSQFGKNLADINQWEDVSPNTGIRVEGDKIIQNKGDGLFGISCNLAPELLVVGQSYTFSVESISEHSPSFFGFKLFYYDGTELDASRSYSYTVKIAKKVKSVILYCGNEFIPKNDVVYSKPMIRLASLSDTYEPYIKPNVFAANADGVVSGMRSVSPSMTLLSDTPGVVIAARYNADTERYIANNYVPKSAVSSLEARIAEVEKAAVNKA